MPGSPGKVQPRSLGSGAESFAVWGTRISQGLLQLRTDCKENRDHLGVTDGTFFLPNWGNPQQQALTLVSPVLLPSGAHLLLPFFFTGFILWEGLTVVWVVELCSQSFCTLLHSHLEWALAKGKPCPAFLDLEEATFRPVPAVRGVWAQC
jgi:hypothetical protein